MIKRSNDKQWTIQSWYIPSVFLISNLSGSFSWDRLLALTLFIPLSGSLDKIRASWVSYCGVKTTNRGETQWNWLFTWTTNNNPVICSEPAVHACTRFVIWWHTTISTCHLKGSDHDVGPIVDCLCLDSVQDQTTGWLLSMSARLSLCFQR